MPCIVSLHEGEEEVTGRVRNWEQPPDLDLELGGPSLLYPARFPTCITLPPLPFSSSLLTAINARVSSLLPPPSSLIQSAGLLSLSFKQLGLSSHSLSDLLSLSSTTTTTAVLFYLIPFLISTPFASFFDS
jgi:hypothetical protein